MKLSENRTKFILILAEALVLIALLVVVLLRQLGIIGRTESASGTEVTQVTDVQSTENSIEGQTEEDTEPTVTYSFDVEETLAGMTDAQKIAQLILCTPETLTRANRVTSVGSTTQSAIKENPVGGLIYNLDNYVDDDQVTALLTNTEASMAESTPVGAYYLVASPDGTVNAYTSASDAAEVLKALATEENNGEYIDAVLDEATVDTGSIYDVIASNHDTAYAVIVDGAVMIYTTGNVRDLTADITTALTNDDITSEMLDEAVTEILEAKAIR